MAQRMKRYIEEQPALWEAALHSLPALLCRAAGRMAGSGPAIRRVVMIGSGSSHYAAQAACRFLPTAGGIEFRAVTPQEPGSFGLPDEGTVYWAVSQSGRSTSTQRAVEALLAQGARVCTFTADPEFPLSRQALLHILLPCGEETVGPKTKGMTITLLTLLLAGKALLRDGRPDLLEEDARRLLPAVSAAAENLERSRMFAAQHREALCAAGCLTVVAAGAALPLAREGALKLLETLYIPAFAWEFEEYLHGVHNSITPGSVMLFVPGTGEERPRMRRLISFCASQGCVCLVIDTAGDIPPDEEKARGQVFTLPLLTPGPEEALGLSLLLPFQAISAEISERKGIDCDKPRFPDFYAALNTKLPA